jgi:hypothetical protein
MKIDGQTDRGISGQTDRETERHGRKVNRPIG